MATSLDTPPSTAYRTVRDMLAHGFLESAGEGRYRLGACFIEYDRLIRDTDPLYRAATPVLHDLVEAAQLPCTAVLARLYNGTVMCVADASSALRPVRTSYERGRPQPLTRGATSKAILALLPPRRLARLLDPADPGLRTQLAAIRREGVAVTRGEVDPGLVGIAVPLATSGLLASLSLVLDATTLDPKAEHRLTTLLTIAAKTLAAALA